MSQSARGSGRLTWLELAAGRALEPPGRPPVRRPPRSGPDARRALEDAILRAMVRGRASVSFSGGRDSSLVLAVACSVARREGLEMPVAISMRHPSAMSDETAWQELVISHLGVSDWVKVEIGDSMDVLSPGATGLLAAVGVQAPPNAYLHLPVVRVAPEGTVLTGVGGDEILGTPGGRLARVLVGRTRPEVRDLARLGVAMAPRPVRARIRSRHVAPRLPWLLPAAVRQVARAIATEDVRSRARWDVAALDFALSRSVQLGQRALRAVAAAHGRELRSPLVSAEFVAAFAREVGPGGPRSRTAAMRMLAHDLLPPQVLDRRSKAVFSAMVWGPRFREFARGWQPDSLQTELRELVDADLLAEAWQDDVPHFSSMMLLQHAWLSEHASAVGLALDAGGCLSQASPGAGPGQLDHR